MTKLRVEIEQRKTIEKQNWALLTLGRLIKLTKFFQN